MATANSLSGGAQLDIELISRFSGDSSGSRVGRMQQRVAWEPVGGTPPALLGWLRGSFLPAAGSLELAHPTDPLGAMGDAEYSDGLNPAGARLQGLWIYNGDAAATLTLTRSISAGLPFLDTVGDALSLAPGEQCLLLFTQGRGPLIYGVNDRIDIAVSAAFAAAAEILVIYGP